jgi:hypothetical protein
VTHTHPAYGGVDSPCIDLGHDVCVREFRPGMLLVAHDRGLPFDPAIHVSERCEGSIPVRAPETPHPTDSASWEMTGSLTGGDLTLVPSIKCRGGGKMCTGSHGFIRDGTWVPA